MTDHFDHDHFEHDDAAYVLGALSAVERAAFEAHLSTCSDCRARVAELADLPALLAQVSVDDLRTEDVPETLLPNLLNVAAKRRRRRLIGLGALSTVAAACLIAITVMFWPSSTSEPAPQQMTALANVPVTATVEMQSTAWGTQITLKCRYKGGTYTPTAQAAGFVYGLTVIDTDGQAENLGTWGQAPSGLTLFTSGTSLARGAIAAVQITAGGHPVLEAKS